MTAGKYFFHHGQMINSGDFCLESLQNSKAVYEVIRILKGIPLFVEDHLIRLKKSLLLTYGNSSINQHEIIQNILLLAAKNEFSEGNVKLVISQESPNIGSTNMNSHLYFIPHHYPTPDEYKNGYRMKSLVVERPNPSAKVINENLAQTVLKMKMEDDRLDEVLLVRHDGIVAEGSKSNIFFVLGDRLFTASKNLVLAGITRKKIIELCSWNKIECSEKSDLFLSDISKMDGAFITGTSPKVMPVKQIDNVCFDVENKTIEKIAEIYDKMIVDYMDGFQFSY